MAAAYEDIYVPRIFIPWGELLVDAVRLRPGESVLDVATGSGTVARIAAERVGPKGSVTGTDFSAAMLEMAKAKPPRTKAASIEYVEAPAAAAAARRSV